MVKKDELLDPAEMMGPGTPVDDGALDPGEMAVQREELDPSEMAGEAIPGRIMSTPIAASPSEPQIRPAAGPITQLYRRVNERAGIRPTEVPGKLWDALKGTGQGLMAQLTGRPVPEEAGSEIVSGAGGLLRAMSYPFRAVGELTNASVRAVGGDPTIPGAFSVPPKERGTMGDVVEAVAPFGPQIAKGIAKHIRPEEVAKVLEAPEQLLTSVPTSASKAISPEPAEIGNEFHKAVTLMLKDVSHPESVMGLEEPGKVVYTAVREAERRITRDVSKLERVLLGATKGLSGDDLNKVGMILDGQKVEAVSPSVDLAARTIRRHVLDPIAKMHKLPKDGRMLQDYFPHFFTAEGVPRDAVGSFAKELASRQGVAFESLDTAQQGGFVKQATEALKKLPQEAFFGPVSKHRLTEAAPFNYNAGDVVSRYIRGAVKKYYLDDALSTTQAALPSMSPALREYTTQFVNAFRGVPASSEVITNQGIRTMLDAMERVPVIGEKLSRGYQTMFGKSSREFANTLKMIQADAKLGANVFSPLQNLSQTSINTYTKVGGRTLVDALKLRHTAKGKSLLDRSGVFYDVAKYDFMPEELSGLTARWTDKLLWAFNKSETFNREVAYLAGYLKAHKANSSAPWSLLDDAGRHLVDETQFIFSPIGRPALLRGPVGSTAGQFKLFTVNQLRFIKNLRGAEVPRFALATALHGGMKGIPGAQTLMKALVGYGAVQYIKDQELPSFVENLIIGGAPRTAGVSLEQDIGTGFVPSSLEEVLTPAAASLPLKLAREGSAALRGEPAARENILRETVRNLPGGVQLERGREAYLAARRGGIKVNKEGRYEQKLSPRDVLLQGALGAKTTSAAKFYEAQEFMGAQSEEIKTAKKRLMSEVTKAFADSDMERFDSAIAEAVQIPGLLQSTNLKTVSRPSLVREFLSMPKAARLQVLAKNPGFKKMILKELASQSELYEGDGE